MSDIIRAIKNAFKKVMATTPYPNDTGIFINEAVGTGGKEFDLYKLLGGSIPNNIEIYSTQNFTLRRSLSDKSPSENDQWPRTLVLGTWHKWRKEAWYRVTITPGVAATITGHISAKDGVNKNRGKED